MVTVVVSEKEKSLLEKLRKIPFGEVTIIMHEGKPQRIEKGVAKTQL